MASSVGLSSTSMTSNDQSTAGLTLEILAMDVNLLIEEAEGFVLAGRGALLPEGWAGCIRSMIDQVEAQIQSEQDSHSLEGEHRRVRDSWDSTEIWWRSKKQVTYSSTATSCQETSLSCDEEESADPEILSELGNHNECIEETDVLEEPRPKIADLQENVYALLSVISMQMAGFRSLKQRKTNLNNHIEDLYESPDGMGERLCLEILQIRFDAISVQLQAVFNMQCHERESQGGDVDDEEMMAMVLENQKRTEMLRSIQNVLERTEGLLRELGRK
ncbi:hypothetical protein VSDG_02990 [Cytospora chrysosperma]|uniref:Uncharacterized protein n=1 Tax=Cytospora chrysosperma TaxID=252740 RepID=A0A423W900_CYTCH|nr:hypothetical protein VSDG_02990 [Valsa sordida]